jgi:hypothetical protein
MNFNSFNPLSLLSDFYTGSAKEEPSQNKASQESSKQEHPSNCYDISGLIKNNVPSTPNITVFENSTRFSLLSELEKTKNMSEIFKIHTDTILTGSNNNLDNIAREYKSKKRRSSIYKKLDL